MAPFFRVKKIQEVKIPLNCLDMYMLGIKPKIRKDLEQAELECNLEKYKDILFSALVADSMGEWWRT